MEMAIAMEPKGKKQKYDKYEIEDAARTLKRAEEIKMDAELMKLVSKQLSKEKKAITSIQELKDIASNMPSDEEDMD